MGDARDRAVAGLARVIGVVITAPVDPVTKPGLVLTAQVLLLSSSPLLTVALIGRMPGDAMHLRGLYQPVTFVLLAVVIGLGTTAQVASARAVGAGEPHQVRPILVSLLRTGAGVSLALTAACLFLLPVIDRHLLALIVAMTSTLPFSVAGELTSGALLGAGFAGVSTAVAAAHVALNGAVVAVVGLGLGGGLVSLPVAAAVAGGAEFLAGALVLKRKGLLTGTGGTRFSPRPLLRQIGLPAAGTSLVLFAVTLVLVVIVTPFGPEAVTAVAVGAVVGELALAPAFGFGIMMGTLMNRALAARERHRAWSVFQRGMTLVAAGYVLFVLAMSMTGPRLAPVVTGDPATREAVSHYLSIVGPSLGVTGIVVTALTVVQQLGRGTLPLLLNVLHFVAMLSVGAALTAHGPLEALYWTMSAAALVSAGMGVPLAWRITRRAVFRT